MPSRAMALLPQGAWQLVGGPPSGFSWHVICLGAGGASQPCHWPERAARVAPDAPETALGFTPLNKGTLVVRFNTIKDMFLPS